MEAIQVIQLQATQPQATQPQVTQLQLQFMVINHTHIAAPLLQSNADQIYSLAVNQV